MARTTTKTSLTYSFGDLDGMSAAEFLDILAAAVAEIPIECRSTATFDIELWGDSYRDATLSLVYERPETDEERALRMAQEQIRDRNREAADRAQLAQLIAKYGVSK